MGERNLNTPLMKQYVQFKAQYPQAVLLRRVGDFYEAYGDDAITVSKVLGIVLTKRSNGVPSSMELCGFPHHSLQTYLPKLVRAGYKVAVPYQKSPWCMHDLAHLGLEKYDHYYLREK